MYKILFLFLFLSALFLLAGCASQEPDDVSFRLEVWDCRGSEPRRIDQKDLPFIKSDASRQTIPNHKNTKNASKSPSADIKTE